MNCIKVKTGCFTPLVKVTDRQCIKKALLIFFTVFGLSGCATSQNTSPLAPSPPELRFSSLYYEQQSAEAARYMFEPKQEQKPIVAKDILMAASVAGIEAASQPQNFEKNVCKQPIAQLHVLLVLVALADIDSMDENKRHFGTSKQHIKTLPRQVRE